MKFLKIRRIRGERADCDCRRQTSIYVLKGGLEWPIHVGRIIRATGKAHKAILRALQDSSLLYDCVEAVGRGTQIFRFPFFFSRISCFITFRHWYLEAIFIVVNE